MAKHDDFAQLNFSRRFTPTLVQQFNMVLTWFLTSPCTVADISIRSSAYMIQPTKPPFIVQPVLTSRNLIIKALINILKIAGESELPYLTPLRTSKGIDTKPCHRTLTTSLQLASNCK